MYEKCQYVLGCPKPPDTHNGKYCSIEHSPYGLMFGVTKRGSKAGKTLEAKRAKREKLKELAARGLTMREAADEMGIHYRSVLMSARRWKIKFRLVLPTEPRRRRRKSGTPA